MTSATAFIVWSASLCLINLGFSTVQNRASVAIPTGCSVVSPQIIDLYGDSSCDFTTYLATGNSNLLTLKGASGRNNFKKIQLTSDRTGIKFFKKIHKFKACFSAQMLIDGYLPVHGQVY